MVTCRIAWRGIEEEKLSNFLSQSETEKQRESEKQREREREREIMDRETDRETERDTMERETDRETGVQPFWKKRTPQCLCVCWSEILHTMAENHKAVASFVRRERKTAV